jgi:N-methylhydantoinase A
VYQREALPVGFRFPGPAIVEQADTTTLIHPGQTAAVDRFANMVIELDALGG